MFSKRYKSLEDLKECVSGLELGDYVLSEFICDLLTKEGYIYHVVVFGNDVTKAVNDWELEVSIDDTLRRGSFLGWIFPNERDGLKCITYELPDPLPGTLTFSDYNYADPGFASELLAKVKLYKDYITQPSTKQVEEITYVDEQYIVD